MVHCFGCNRRSYPLTYDVYIHWGWICSNSYWTTVLCIYHRTFTILAIIKSFLINIKCLTTVVLWTVKNFWNIKNGAVGPFLFPKIYIFQQKLAFFSYWKTCQLMMSILTGTLLNMYCPVQCSGGYLTLHNLYSIDTHKQILTSFKRSDNIELT